MLSVIKAVIILTILEKKSKQKRTLSWRWPTFANNDYHQR